MKTRSFLANCRLFALLFLIGSMLTGGLLTRCKSQEPAPLRPKADFRLATTNCTAPCDPGITNLSQFGVSYRWEFGDGGTSTDESPAHSYTKGGTYLLKLTVTGEQNQTSDTTQTVTVQGLAPTAAFTVQNDNCTTACEITFQNQSANALSYQWEFGDGGTSTDANPKHTYTKGGTYTAKLTATGDQGKTASTTHTVTIKSQPVPVASFLIQNDNCIAPCTVVLQNQSTNATTYSWKIITGYAPAPAGSICATGSSCPVYRTTSDQNPSQTYNAPAPLQGIRTQLPYTVELTATGPGGTQTISKNVTIREPLPVADFTFTTSGSLGKVLFTNKSANASSYLWNFSNGTTSTDENPTTTYGSSGTYSVTLQATNSTGTSEVKKSVSVSVIK